MRVDAAQAYRKSQRGDAILVCAYDDEEKCERLRLEGALTLGEFRERKSGLPDEIEVIFYCT